MRRLAIIILLSGVALGVVIWWLLPQLLANMPGRVRYYLPEVIVVPVTTPLPTALPAPDHPPAAALALALATPSATPEPAGVSGVELPIPAPAVTPSMIPVMESIEAEPTIPPYVRISGLPIIPQKFNNCGPTNLSLVLNYYGLDVDQFDVAAVVRPNYEDRNVSPEELAGFVRQETDLDAGVFVGGDIAAIRRLVAAGYPVIIESGLLPDEATGWMGHYLTIFGYDDITRHFYVRDTYLGPWQRDGLAAYDKVERDWSAFNHTFVVVYPVEKVTEVEAILGEDYADPTRMWTLAVDRARRAISVNSDDAFAWFNLGASLTELAHLSGDQGGYEPAAAAFDQARRLGLPPRMLWYQFKPYVAYLATGRYADVIELTDLILSNQGGRNVEETFLYRGYAFRELGDEAAARAAFTRVTQLNPHSTVAAKAQNALSAQD